jgi:hypothetical protein
MSILVCVCVIFFVPAQATDVKKRTSQQKGHDLKLQKRTSRLTSHVQIWVITFETCSLKTTTNIKKNPEDLQVSNHHQVCQFVHGQYLSF